MPGKRLQLRRRARKRAAEARHHLLRAAMHVARAAVVAQAAPQRRAPRPRCRRPAPATSGKRCEEAREVAQHGRHLRLLQHDLGQPHAVRVARVLPGQLAAAVRALPARPRGRQNRPAISGRRRGHGGSCRAQRHASSVSLRGGGAGRVVAGEQRGQLAQPPMQFGEVGLLRRRFRRGARRGCRPPAGCARPPRCRLAEIAAALLAAARRAARRRPCSSARPRSCAASLTTRSRLASARTSLSQNSGCASLSTLPTPRYWMWLRSIWSRSAARSPPGPARRGACSVKPCSALSWRKVRVQHRLDLGAGRLHLAQVVAQRVEGLARTPCAR